MVKNNFSIDYFFRTALILYENRIFHTIVEFCSKQATDKNIL